MNEIEKVIGEVEKYDMCPDAISTESCKVIVAALREKQARESGCDYCLTTWPNHAGGLSDIWHGNQLSVGYGIYREINYCPMCGKRLEEHHEAD